MMKLSENLSNSLEYAKKMFTDGGRLIILIVLNIIPIVNWIVVGYAARVLSESPGTEKPPKLEEYGKMFINGAKLFFAALIYMLIPAILIAAGGGALYASRLTMEGNFVPPFVVSGAAGLTLLILGIILAIGLLIVLAMGMAHMVKTGKFGKAFAFSEIVSIIGGVGWGKYLAWILILIVITVLVSAVASIPIVGWIISLVISPVLSVFVFRSLGLLYNDGAPAELRVQPSVPGALVCSSCGTSLQPLQRFCPNCGAAAPVPTVSEAMKFCVNCGAKIPSDVKFCGSCGAKQP